MSEFPSLVPSAAPITPGSWAAGSHQALSGGRSIVRVSSAETGRRLRLTFENITEEHFLWIRNHYRGHRSGFDSFGFNTTTLAAALTPSGYSWRWAAPPQVTDRHADVFSVSCEFLAVPRAFVKVPGRNWITPATTFTRGAWAVFRSFFASGANWSSAAGTITRGAWSVFTSYFANGATWASAATTLTRGVWANIEPDPDFSSVSLLLLMNGADNSTTFTDSSANALTVTANGNAKISTAQSKYGGASALFDGSNDYLSLAPATLLQLSADFTIECWVRCSSNSDMVVGSSSSDSNTQIFRLNEGGSGRLSFYLNGTQVFSPTAAGITTNAWQHLALCRSGSNTRMFVDGVQIGSTNTTWSGTFRMDKIGMFFFSGSPYAYSFNGYIDDLRITKAVARYTANFTPPTVELPSA